MGFQQLLVIAICFCLIAIAVYAGYNVVQNFYQESDREQLYHKLFQTYQAALQYRKTHSSLGGGNGTYNGWKIPEKLKDTDAGRISFHSGENYIVLVGESRSIGWDGENPIKVWVRFHDINGRTIRFSN